MNVAAISSASSANIAALMAYGAKEPASAPKTAGSAPETGRDSGAVKKAAGQFEAIILRQLLAPAIEPVMSGGLGGSQGTGGGIYGYMLTDALANSLAQGGGLGLSRMLEKQLTPRATAADTKPNGPVVATSAQPHPLKTP